MLCVDPSSGMLAQAGALDGVVTLEADAGGTAAHGGALGFPPRPGAQSSL